MAGYEQTIVVGNLGGDPRTHRFDNGGSVTSFSVAVTQRWNDRQSGEQKEKTNWYKVSAWGNLSTAMEKLTSSGALRKGKQVMVVGTVEAKVFESNGQQRASLELKAQQVQLLGTRSDESGNSSDNKDEYTPEDEDEIPF